MDEEGTLVVRTSISEDGRFIEMKICDNGVGIPPNLRKRFSSHSFQKKVWVRVQGSDYLQSIKS